MTTWTDGTADAEVHHLLAQRVSWVVLACTPLALVGIALIGQLTPTTWVSAACLAIACIATLSMHREISTHPVKITKTTLKVALQEIPLEEIAGYWLQKTPHYTVVHFEFTKPTMLPLSLSNPETSLRKIRESLGMLPELEPRESHWIDRISWQLIPSHRRTR
jgi:hypothetical protein